MAWFGYWDICFCSNPKYPKKCLKCRRNYVTLTNSPNIHISEGTLLSVSNFGTTKTHDRKCDMFLKR